jgi:hypothetical protein
VPFLIEEVPQSMSDPNTPDGPRRPYAKPEVRKVHLRPEEAVLGNCKAGTISGPGVPTCTMSGNCFSIGS